MATQTQPLRQTTRRPRPWQRHPLLAVAREAILLDYLEIRARRPENRTAVDRHADLGLKAMRLAPTLDICRALLRGEAVPAHMLDQQAVAGYGRRTP